MSLPLKQPAETQRLHFVCVMVTHAEGQESGWAVSGMRRPDGVNKGTGGHVATGQRTGTYNVKRSPVGTENKEGEE